MNNKKAVALRIVAGFLAIAALLVALFFLPIVKLNMPLSYVGVIHSTDGTPDRTEVRNYPAVVRLRDYIDAAESAQLALHPEKEGAIRREYETYRQMLAGENLVVRRSLVDLLVAFYPTVQICRHTEALRSMKENPALSDEELQNITQTYTEGLDASSIETAAALLLFNLPFLQNTENPNLPWYQQVNLKGWLFVGAVVLLLVLALIGICRLLILMIKKIKTKNPDPKNWQPVTDRIAGELRVVSGYLLASYFAGHLLESIIRLKEKEDWGFAFGQARVELWGIVVLAILFWSALLLGIAQMLTLKKRSANRKYMALRMVRGIVRVECLLLVGVCYVRFLEAWQTAINGFIIGTFFVALALLFWWARRFVHTLLHAFVVEAEIDEKQPSSVAPGILLLLGMLAVKGIFLAVDIPLRLLMVFWVTASIGVIGLIVMASVNKKLRESIGRRYAVMEENEEEVQEEAQERVDVSVWLSGIGERKLAAIQVLHEEMGVPLIDAVELVYLYDKEGFAKFVRANVPKGDIPRFQELFSKAGARVTIR